MAKSKHQVDIILKGRDLASKTIKVVDRSFTKLRLSIAGAAIKKAFSVFAGLITKLISLLKKLAKVAAVTLGILAVFVVKLGAVFDKNMSRVNALVGESDEAFKALTLTARKLGETTVFTATQASEAMSELALAGFSARQIIDSMPAVLNLAAAGMLEMAEAADIATGIMFGMGVPASELQNSVDVLTKAFTSSRTSLGDLGEGFKTLGPIARTAGLSLEDTVATMATLAQAGFRGERAGVGLRNVLIRLSSESNENAVAIGRLVSTTKDLDGTLRPIPDIVDEMNARFGDISAVEKLGKLVDAFGVRAGPIMASLLIKGGNELRRYMELMEDAGGTAQEIADKQLDNLWGSFIKLRSVIQEVGLVVFNFGKVELRDLVDRIRQFILDNKGLFALWGKRIKLAITLVKDSLLSFVSFITSDYNRGLKLMRDLFIASLKSMIQVSIAIAATGGQAIFAGLKLAATGSLADPMALQLAAAELFKQRHGRTAFRTEDGGVNITEKQQTRDRNTLRAIKDELRPQMEANEIARLTRDAIVRLDKLKIDIKKNFGEILPQELLDELKANKKVFDKGLAALTIEVEEQTKLLEDKKEELPLLPPWLDYPDLPSGSTSGKPKGFAAMESRFLRFPGQTALDRIGNFAKKTSNSQDETVALLTDIRNMMLPTQARDATVNAIA